MVISVEKLSSLSTLYLDQLLVSSCRFSQIHKFSIFLITAGDDFVADTITVTFAIDQTVASVEVPIVNDNQVEDMEIFNASLTTADSNVMLRDDTATVFVLDNDGTILPTLILCNCLSHLLFSCSVGVV